MRSRSDRLPVLSAASATGPALRGLRRSRRPARRPLSPLRPPRVCTARPVLRQRPRRNRGVASGRARCCDPVPSTPPVVERSGSGSLGADPRGRPPTRGADRNADTDKYPPTRRASTLDPFDRSDPDDDRCPVPDPGPGHPGRDDGPRRASSHHPGETCDRPPFLVGERPSRTGRPLLPSRLAPG